MNMAVYSESEGGALVRNVENHESLESAILHYLEAQKAPGVPQTIVAKREKLLGWPESRMIKIGRVGIAVVGLDDAVNIAAFSISLDSAVAIIQETMGVKDGGIAGAHFSGFDSNDWRSLSIKTRLNMMEKYAAFEEDALFNW